MKSPYSRRQAKPRGFRGGSRIIPGCLSIIPVLLITACPTHTDDLRLNFTITYTPKSIIAYAGIELEAVIPTIRPAGAGVKASFAITKGGKLPDGLRLDPATGAISGTVPAGSSPAGARSYTITATGTSAKASGKTAAFDITVEVKRASVVSVSYPASRAALNLEKGTMLTSGQLTSLTPVLTPAGASVTYSISPDLNANTGLNFDTADGRITGVPTKAAVSREYTVRAEGIGPYTGTASAGVTIRVDVAGSSVTYSGSFTPPGGAETTFNFTGRDGSESKPYELNLNRDVLGNPATNVNFFPVFNPPEAGVGAAYALQEKNMLGSYESETPTAFNTATGGGSFNPSNGLAFSTANGEITGTARKIITAEYKIIITLKSDSVYSDGSTAKEVFFTLTVANP